MLNQNDINISLIPKEVGKRPELRSSSGEAVVIIFNRILSGVLFFSVALWGGLYWYKESRLKGELEKRNQELIVAEQEIAQKGNFDEIKKQSSVIEAAINLIKNHLFASNILRFVETHTHQDVRFSSFGYQYTAEAGARIDLSADAKNVDAIAKQIIAFSTTLDDILRQGEAGSKRESSRKNKTDTAAYDLQFDGYKRNSNDGTYSFSLSFTLPSEFLKTNFLSLGTPSAGEKEEPSQ